MGCDPESELILYAGCNCPYEGASAEWIVERPGQVPSHPYPVPYYDLADYVSFHMDASYNSWLPGSGPASAPTWVAMQCTSWNPSYACSYGTLSSVSNYDSGSGQIYFLPAGATVTYNY
jgi:hypothetical protein